MKERGNYQDYGMRAYDGRLGRFFSVDPFVTQQSDISPYVFTGNSPIRATDINGDSIYFVIGREKLSLAKEVILKMPHGKEIWDMFATSATHDVYIAQFSYPEQVDKLLMEL
jgi:RHS repeat-associated protein